MSQWYENDEFWEQLLPLLRDESVAGSPSSQVGELVDLLQLEQGTQVLDLCCGIGRHAVELARRGFQVTGVDRTAAYLEIARQQAARAGVQAEFVGEDMQTFSRPDSFHAAINMLSSFGYLPDREADRRVLDNLYASLKPGGRLLMEMAGKEVLARIFQERDWRQLQDGPLLLEERQIVRGWEGIQSRWIFIEGSEQREFTIQLRLYSGAELAALLRQAGFSSVELYGGLDGSPYDQTAKRLVVTARK